MILVENIVGVVEESNSINTLNYKTKLQLRLLCIGLLIDSVAGS